MGFCLHPTEKLFLLSARVSSFIFISSIVCEHICRRRIHTRAMINRRKNRLLGQNILCCSCLSLSNSDWKHRFMFDCGESSCWCSSNLFRISLIWLQVNVHRWFSHLSSIRRLLLHFTSIHMKRHVSSLFYLVLAKSMNDVSLSISFDGWKATLFFHQNNRVFVNNTEPQRDLCSFFSTSKLASYNKSLLSSSMWISQRRSINSGMPVYFTNCTECNVYKS